MPQARPARLPNPNRTAVFKTGVQADDDPFEFVMSSDDVDRMGDIIDIDGVDLAAFAKNPVALWNHDSGSPIGTWEDVRKISGQLRGRLVLAAAGTSSLIDRVRQLIEQRIIRAVSVGFKPLEMSALKETGGLRFTRSELLECSVVAVPANANALRIKGLRSDPLDAQIFSGTVPPRQAPSRAWGDPAAQPRALTRSAPSGSGTRTMNISEKIMAAQQRAIAIDDEVQAIQDAAENDNAREFTDDEATSIAALADEKDRTVKSIDTLTLMEKTLASRAKPTDKFAPVVHATVKTAKPWEVLLKVATARVIAHMQHRPVDLVLAERYREDERVKAVHDFMTKSATNIADTLTPGWAAELVREDVKGFLSDLEGVSVYAALSAMGISIDFGNAASVLIPRRTDSGTMAGGWVGETGVIPVVQGTIGGASLFRYKMGAITVFSKELERTATVEIENFLRTEIRKDTVKMIDQKLLDNKAMVPGVRPAGLLNGVTPTASSGSTPANIATDIKALLGPLVSANALDNPAIILNPIHVFGLSQVTTATGDFIYKQDIQDGKIGMFPFIASTHVAVGTVVAVNADDFATAFGVPEYDVSDTATLTMANANATAPTQATADGTIITADQVPVGGGIHVDGSPTGPATAGVEVAAMFQQWSVALRSVTPISWAMVRPGMVTALSGVAW